MPVSGRQRNTKVSRGPDQAGIKDITDGEIPSSLNS